MLAPFEEIDFFSSTREQPREKKIERRNHLLLLSSLSLSISRSLNVVSQGEAKEGETRK